MNNFTAITKQQLQQRRPSMDVSALCGPASIAMMLQYCGLHIQLDEVLRKMQTGGAFTPTTGTILQRVPGSLGLPMRFFRYIPSFLLFRLLRRGFMGAASISTEAGSHIVFVVGCDREQVFYYDSNSTPIRHSMSIHIWKTVFNKRALLMHPCKNQRTPL